MSGLLNIKLVNRPPLQEGAVELLRAVRTPCTVSCSRDCRCGRVHRSQTPAVGAEQHSIR